MKKLVLSLFLFCLVFSVFAEPNYIYRTKRKYTINKNTEEALNLSTVVSGELKGNYCILSATLNTGNNTGTCYAIYCENKQNALALIMELESSDGNKITYADYLKELIKDNEDFTLLEDTLETEENFVVSLKMYSYNPTK